MTKKTTSEVSYKKGFFNVKNYIDKNYPSHFFITPRNTGKTTSMLYYLREKCENETYTYIDPNGKKITKNKQFMWLRRKDIEVEHFTRSIRPIIAQWGWFIKADVVYKMEKSPTGNFSVEMGRIASLSTQSVLTSNFFNHTMFLIYDEFMGMDAAKVAMSEFNSFINLLITVERLKIAENSSDKEGFKVFCFANYVKNNNLFYNKLRIFPEPGVKVYERPEFGAKVFILGKDEFDIPNNSNTASCLLAKCSDEMTSFAYDNVALEDNGECVIDPELLSNISPRYALLINGIRFNVCDAVITKTNTDIVYIYAYKKFEGEVEEFGVKNIDLIEGSVPRIIPNAKKHFEYFMRLSANKELFHSSFEGIEFFNKLIEELLGKFEKKKK